MVIALQWSFWWLYLGVIVGHAVVGLAFLSRLHGIGLPPRWMTRIEIMTLFIPAGVAAILGWLIVFWRVDKWPVPASLYAYVCCVVTFVFLPVGLFLRLSKKPLANVRISTQRHCINESTNFSESSAFIGTGHNSWMLKLRGNESTSLQTLCVTISLPSLPEQFTDLRILQISDLHFTRAYRRDYYDWVAEVAGEIEVDLVVFTGDLLDDPTTLDWTIPVLGGLRGRLGQFAILGNHDVIHRPGRVRKALRASGFDIVDGRWISLEDEGKTIALGGTSAPWGPELDLKDCPEADLAIILSHSPDLFPAIARSQSADLVLAGHTHGGQIRVPIFGPLIMPCLTGLRFDRGLFKQGTTLMNVTQGVGGKHPLRYNCPPEITCLTITRQPIDQRGDATLESHVLSRRFD